MFQHLKQRFSCGPVPVQYEVPAHERGGTAESATLLQRTPVLDAIREKRLSRCDLQEHLATADRYRCLVNTIGPAGRFEIVADRAEAGVDMAAVCTRDGIARIDDEAAARVVSVLSHPTFRAFVSDDVPISLNILTWGRRAETALVERPG